MSRHQEELPPIKSEESPAPTTAEFIIDSDSIGARPLRAKKCIRLLAISNPSVDKRPSLVVQPFLCGPLRRPREGLRCDGF